MQITAHLETALNPNQTLVYCATFQLAWNQLCDDVIHAPLELAGNPVIAQALNQRLVNAKDLDEASYLALAGFGRDGIVERIQQALWEKFEQKPSFDLGLDAPTDILAYAYLEKALKFARVFQVFDHPLRFCDGGDVQSFGIYEEHRAAEQVKVWDYRGPDDFVIQL